MVGFAFLIHTSLPESSSAAMVSGHGRRRAGGTSRPSGGATPPRRTARGAHNCPVTAHLKSFRPRPPTPRRPVGTRPEGSSPTPSRCASWPSGARRGGAGERRPATGRLRPVPPGPGLVASLAGARGPGRRPAGRGLSRPRRRRDRVLSETATPFRRACGQSRWRACSFSITLRLLRRGLFPRLSFSLACLPVHYATLLSIFLILFLFPLSPPSFPFLSSFFPHSPSRLRFLLLLFLPFAILLLLGGGELPCPPSPASSRSCHSSPGRAAPLTDHAFLLFAPEPSAVRGRLGAGGAGGTLAVAGPSMSWFGGSTGTGPGTDRPAWRFSWPGAPIGVTVIVLARPPGRLSRPPAAPAWTGSNPALRPFLGSRARRTGRILRRADRLDPAAATASGLTLSPLSSAWPALLFSDCPPLAPCLSAGC